MSDWLKVGLLCNAVILWLLGGTRFKWARRFVWPLMAALILHLHGVGPWRILGVYLGLVLTCSLGYGEGTSWPRRVAVFLSYSMPSLWLNWHLWPLRFLLTGGGCSLIFWLSRRFNKVDHKVFESTAGWTQAASLIIAT